MNYATRTHVIHQGETLDGIARRYGLGWEAIYKHEANAEFRRRNPHPNLIRPGDCITIPPAPSQILNERIQRLQTIRREAVKMYDDLERELNKDFASLVKRTGSAVDTTATVLTIVKDLTKMSADALATMTKEGKALDQANRAFLKTHLATGTPGMKAAAGVVVPGFVEPTGEEGLAWGVGKVLIKSWFEMQTPSYWAAFFMGRFTGQTPEQSHQAALSQIRNQRQQSLKNLDSKIAEAQRLLTQENDARGKPMPVHR